MKRKLSKIYTPYNSLLIIFLLVLFPLLSHPEEIISSPNAPLVVIDGDSLEIGTSRIRLIGIDAPEYHQNCKDKHKKSYQCGQQSAKYLKSLVQNKTVTCQVHKKDRYNRELCTCYANGVDLNAEMVRAGLAVVYLESAYKKEENEAKAAKKGIWSGRFMRPRLFRILQEQQKKASLSK